MTMTADTPGTTLKDGRVVAIAGPVVDVEFPPDALPEINFALEMDAELEGETITITAEVAQQIGDSSVDDMADVGVRTLAPTVAIWRWWRGTCPRWLTWRVTTRCCSASPRSRSTSSASTSKASTSPTSRRATTAWSRSPSACAARR